MTWRTITPECDTLHISPVRVETPDLVFNRTRFVYDGTTALLIDGLDKVWAAEPIDRIEQDDQRWRVWLADGTLWDMSRSGGCNCGSGPPVPKSALGT